MRHKAAIAGVAAGLALGAGLAASGTWLAVKAVVAQALLQRAWEQTRLTGVPHRPWPWSDTHPLARLRVPALNVAQIILDGGSGRTLAFGPGRVPGTAIPGEPGTSIVSAHRDSHFRFLARLRAGDLLVVERMNGVRRYRVERSLVVDLASQSLATDPAEDLLMLVTCFPFDQWTPGGTRRYVVVAKPVPDDPIRQHRQASPTRLARSQGRSGNGPPR